MTSKKDTRIYDSYDAYIQTKPDWDFMPSPSLSLAVLCAQFAVAVAVVFYGCRSKRWD